MMSDRLETPESPYLHQLDDRPQGSRKIYFDLPEMPPEALQAFIERSVREGAYFVKGWYWWHPRGSYIRSWLRVTVRYWDSTQRHWWFNGYRWRWDGVRGKHKKTFPDLTNDEFGDVENLPF
jgi:hypothetical protein